jgi:hypothetical protein
MTEYSRLWATSGVGDGAAGGYTADQLFEIYRALFTGAVGANRSGAAPDYGSKLAVSGSASPVSVADGAALVYGVPYFNTSAVSVAIPTPTTGTRIDRVVLRASWAAQTVRVTRIAGVEGAGTPPNLQQTAGVTWDMPLAQVSITTAGVMTLADERQYLQGLGDGGVGTAKLADSAVTTAKIADDAVTTGKIAAGAVGTTDIADDAVTAAKIAAGAVGASEIADGAVGASEIADGAVGTSELADDAISNAKLANMAVNRVKGRATTGTGDPEDLTPAQLVTIIKTADGTGTGLDADLLDGLNADAFAAVAHSHASADLADGSVTSAKIAAGAVTSTKLGASAVGTTALGSKAVTAAKIDDGTITATQLADSAVTASKLASDSVSNAKLANMAVNRVKGRATTGTGDPEDLTADELCAIIRDNITSADATINTTAGFASTGSNVSVRKYGGVLAVRGNVQYNGSTTTIHLEAVLLPTGFRPDLPRRCVVVDESTPAIHAAYVNNDGSFKIKAPVNGKRYYLDVVVEA